MTKYFLRIITASDSQDTAEEILSFLQTFSAVSELYAEPIKPYWKTPEQGELLCSFSSPLPIEKIQAVLAGHWEGDVADARWSQLHLPHSTFLWLTL